MNERVLLSVTHHREHSRPPALTPGTVAPTNGDAAGSAPSSSKHGITITVEHTIETDQVEIFYDLYRAAFGPLRTKAVARQVLTHEEFVLEMGDTRVWKYVAWDDQDRPLALSTLTRDLDTVPWISPEYFAARYPEHAARNAVYYIGFVLTRRERGGHLVLQRLFAAMSEQLAADRAVCGYDICLFNNETMRFAHQIETLARRLAGASTELVDTQTYYSTTWP